MDVKVGNHTETLEPGGYAYLPSNTAHSINPTQDTNIVVIEKPFIKSSCQGVPEVAVGQAQDVSSENPSDSLPPSSVKRLLPDRTEYDMAVNILSFEPGASISQVEVHVMEHGLSMLQGGGVYRLGDSWYPIREGDVLWMASYCPQWFGAIGAEPAAYLLYKDVNRDSLQRFSP